MKERQCAICREVLVRRSDERSQGFALRQTCNAECGNRLRSATMTTIRGGDEKATTKTGTGHCLVCGEPLERREYANGKLEPRNKLEKGRRTCSAECCNKLRGVTHRRRGDKTVEALGPRFCAACGRQLDRRDGESPKAFSKRKTCSAECASTLGACVTILKASFAAPKPPSLLSPVLPAAPGPSSRLPPVLVLPKGRLKAARSVLEERKQCLSCGAPMKRRENEKFDAFMRRKTCCRECLLKHYSAIRSKAKIVPGRRCLVCGKLLTRKGYEMPNIFARRVTCNHACRLALMQSRRTLIDFYGVPLPREVVAAILGLSKSGLRHRFPGPKDRKNRRRRASAPDGPNEIEDRPKRDLPRPGQ
jgi:hypothetical protein